MEVCNSEPKIWYLKNGNKALDLKSLPRCQAVSATTGQTCKRAACNGFKFCGIHLGRYTPGSNNNDNKPGFKHGFYCKKNQKIRKEAKNTLDIIEKLLCRIK